MAEANDAVFMSAPPTTIAHSVSKGSLADFAFVLFASWLFPARTARRVANWSLPACWLLHVCIGLFGVILALLAYIAMVQPPSDILRELEGWWNQWSKIPWTMTFILLGILLYAGGIALGIAFAVSAWGAVADERLRDSLRHSLRQTWIRTPHAVLIALCVGLFAGLLENAGREWRLQNPDPPATVWPAYPMPPTMPSSDPNYTAAQKKYQKEMQEFQVKAMAATRASREWRAVQPWYLRLKEPATIAVGAVGAAWWLAGLLAAVGTRRVVRASERSPLCLQCGYDLSHMSMESRCPECGQPVIESLGPLAQGGAEWERRHAVGAWRAWWRTWRAWGRNVTEFGRSLQLRSPHLDYRSFMLLHLPVVFLVGAAGMAFPVVANPGQAKPFDSWAIVLIVAFVFGLACTIGTTVIICATASLTGWYFSLRSGRNLLPASVQISAYGAMYLLAWEIFGAFLFNGAVHLQVNGMYNLGRELTGIPLDVLFVLTCHIPNVICGLMFMWLVTKGTNAARFANK